MSVVVQYICTGWNMNLKLKNLKREEGRRPTRLSTLATVLKEHIMLKMVFVGFLVSLMRVVRKRAQILIWQLIRDIRVRRAFIAVSIPDIFYRQVCKTNEIFSRRLADPCQPLRPTNRVVSSPVYRSFQGYVTRSVVLWGLDTFPKKRPNIIAIAKENKRPNSLNIASQKQRSNSLRIFHSKKPFIFLKVSPCRNSLCFSLSKILAVFWPNIHSFLDPSSKPLVKSPCFWSKNLWCQNP